MNKRKRKDREEINLPCATEGTEKERERKSMGEKRKK